MHNIGVYKNKCIFRRVHVETKSHLFYECAFVKPLVNIVKNFLNIISDNQFPQFNILHIKISQFSICYCMQRKRICVFVFDITFSLYYLEGLMHCKIREKSNH